jgi:RNA polymerase sigma-70 factor (ECF subfamily)
MTNSQLTGLDDPALVARVADGDAHAFEALYDRYRSRAFGLAVRLTRRRSIAEEVTQDAFVNLWRNAGSYDPARGNLGSWLLTFVRHRAIDSLRSGRRRERDVELEGVAERLEAPGRTDEEVSRREESLGARRLLEKLPADQREVIELAYFGGLSQSEIATKVGIPLGTVKGRSRLALERLRRSVATDSVLAGAR